MRGWGKPMNILIWASCEASRPALYIQCCTKIKPGKMPEEILNRFDTNYIVLPVWECTLLASLTVIILNYKHWMAVCSSPANAAIVCSRCPFIFKAVASPQWTQSPVLFLSHDPSFSFISRIGKFIKVLSLSSDNSILKKNHFIYLLLAVLSLHCCPSFSLVTAIRGYCPVVVRGLFIVVASLVAQHGL